MEKKATLTIPVPRSCVKCPLAYWHDSFTPVCAATDKEIDVAGEVTVRAPFCPLEVEE